MAIKASTPYVESDEKIAARQQMTNLCRRIPTVANCPGVEPWDAMKFAKAQHGRSQGEKIAASFVLLVWSHEQNHTEWSNVPPFDLADAAAHCDAPVREVMAEWLLNPFWV